MTTILFCWSVPGLLFALIGRYSDHDGEPAPLWMCLVGAVLVYVVWPWLVWKSLKRRGK